MLSGNNSILQKASEAKIHTERSNIIGQARIDILGQIAENRGENISKQQLKDILNIYFYENEVEALSIPNDTSTSNEELTSKEGNYKIKLSEIYSGIFSSTVVNTPVEPTDIYVAWCNNHALVFSNNEDAIDEYILENSTSIFDGPRNIKNDEYDYIDNPPAWGDDAGISTVVFLNLVAPKSTAAWFTGLQSLTNIENIGYLNTSNVTNMSGMFGGCSVNLLTLDLSGFDTSKVTDMSYMFESCTALTTIYVSNSFTTEKVTNSSDMFSNCSSLVGGNNTLYNSSFSDKTYACIGTESTPGYFTRKN